MATANGDDPKMISRSPSTFRMFEALGQRMFLLEALGCSIVLENGCNLEVPIHFDLLPTEGEGNHGKTYRAHIVVLGESSNQSSKHTA